METAPSETRHLLKVLASIAFVFVLIGLVGMGGTCIVEALVTLALGWVRYLWRVVPQLNPDPWTVGTAGACLGGVVAGSHYFLRWLAGGEWSWKRTVRCVGLVALMFVAGIAMVGMTHQTAWLVRAPEPLVEGGARTAVARVVSANNLKQIGLATHNYHDANTQLPRSSFSAAGEPMHSWQTALLPYLEKEALYKEIDRTKPWAHPANAQPMRTQIKVFLNPAVPYDLASDLGPSHYAGNVFVVMGDAKKLDSFPQGAPNTVLAGEVSSNLRAWGDPLNVRDPRLGAKSFRGPNGKPTQYAMLDGSVRSFNPQELAELVGKVPE